MKGNGAQTEGLVWSCNKQRRIAFIYIADLEILLSSLTFMTIIFAKLSSSWLVQSSSAELRFALILVITPTHQISGGTSQISSGTSNPQGK